MLCSICKKGPVKFEPFTCLSLPLPCTSMRTMGLTVMSADGSSLPAFLTVNVPEFGRFEDLQKALVTACSLQEDETLLVTEVYKNQIIRFLEDPTDSLTIIGDGAKLVVYRIKKDANNSRLVVFMHQKLEEQVILGKSSPRWKGFGVPLVSRLCDVADGSAVENLYLKLLSSFKIPIEEETTDTAGSTNTEASELRLYLTSDGGNSTESQVMKEKALNSKSKRLNVVARWPVKMLDACDDTCCLLSSLPDQVGSKKSFLLDECLEAFLAEETLGPDDMWYCPRCKEKKQATRKFELQRLPEILIIHLMRFSYSRSMKKKKLEAYVDFPLDDLDLSSYISYKDGQTTYRYMLYAISNHYGSSMEGGHYTAFVRYGGNRWYHFDDSQVQQISQENIRTSAAYVLFYKRLVEDE